MDYLPGNTIIPSEESSPIVLSSLSASTKPIVVFASNDVNDSTLFHNGLTQNIIILYDLFESMGYQSYLLQAGASDESEKKKFIHQYRNITQQDMIKQSIKISIFIEIGTSMDNVTRNYLRSI